MKRTACALVLLMLTILPIGASPLGALSDASLLLSIGFGVAPFGEKVRFPVILEMSVFWPSMVGLGGGFLQTGEMFLVYGLGGYGLDPFAGDVLYLPVKARVGWGRMYGQSSWAAAVSAGIGAVLPVEGTSFSKPFLADVEGLATAVWYAARVDGRRFEVFSEADVGMYLTDE
jgi:hypothetical protein